MAYYRKRPVVVEAWQFNGVPTLDSDPAPQWIKDAVNKAFARGDGPKVTGSPTFNVGGISHNFRNQTLEIGTLEGMVFASVGDWIIKGVKGELYPCKPDIFDATYERV